MNSIYAVFCIAASVAVVYFIGSGLIQDMFMKTALYWLLLALLIRIVVCSLVGFFDDESIILKQNVPKQQIYFEVPFYMFVIVIAAFLFVWLQFYETILNTLKKDDEQQSQ